MDDNKIYKETEQIIKIQSENKASLNTNVTVYSYDKNTAKFLFQLTKNNQPISLGESAVVTIALKFEYANGKAVLEGLIEDEIEGIVSIVIPEEFLGYQGSVTGGIYIDYSNGQSLDCGYFKFSMKRSLIDDELGDMPEYYVEGFENLRVEINDKSEEMKNKLADLDSTFKELDVYNKSQIDDKVDELKPAIDNVTAQLAQMVTNVTKLPIPMVAAKGDGITDDLAGIRNAINITKKGGVVFFPPTSTGYYVKNDTLKHLFLVDKPISIIGQGINSMIKLDENIPIDVDVFLVRPDTVSDYEGYSIERMDIIGANGSKPARHAIHLDTTLSHQKISRALISRNFLFPTGGNSIFLSNPTNSDGFYTSQIEKNLIYSGINMQRAGDSIIIKENTLSGQNGIDIGLMFGSNSLVIEKNNLTARKGLIIRSGHNIKIRDNNFEVGFADSVYENNALIDIDGSDELNTWGLLSVEVTGNNVTYRPDAPVGIIGVRINKARGALVEGNFIANKESTMIHITSLAQETRLGQNMYSSTDPTGLIVDNGRNTIRKSVRSTTPLGAVEVYETWGDIVRNRSRSSYLKTDLVNYQPLTEVNAVDHNYMWSVNNTYGTKHTKSSQQINANGTLGTKKTISTIHDGYESYNYDGLALTDPNGLKWRINVKTDGTLTTTRIN